MNKTQQFEIMVHACSWCQYERPTRSCTWEPVADAVFPTEAAAEEAIDELVGLWPDIARDQYRVRPVGAQHPI